MQGPLVFADVDIQVGDGDGVNSGRRSLSVSFPQRVRRLSLQRRLEDLVFPALRKFDSDFCQLAQDCFAGDRYGYFWSIWIVAILGWWARLFLRQERDVLIARRPPRRSGSR